MPGKYARLEQYLRSLPESQRAITLSFQQIERILNVELPSSAYESELWWTKDKEANHVTPRSWINAGWKVESVELKKKRVRLVRSQPGEITH